LIYMFHEISGLITDAFYIKIGIGIGIEIETHQFKTGMTWTTN